MSVVCFQVSDAVTLDLLTYADLQLLKAQKVTTGTHSLQSTRAPASAPTSKKYLIITYTAEFDR